MRAKDKVRQITAVLEGAGIDAARQEAEMMVCDVLGIDTVSLFKDDPRLSGHQSGMVDDMARRRLRREPIQYILGYVEFLGLRIGVGEGVLIPRPETELLVEHAVRLLEREPSPRIVDLCTGSGCIALALAKRFPSSMVTGTDSSAVAVRYANANAAVNGIENARFLQGDIYGPLSPDAKFDLIVSNPPYIKSGDIGSLQPEVREWEPREALDGGKDGTDCYARILAEAGNFIAHNGILALEIAPDVAGAVVDMTEDAGFGDIVVSRDYSGKERILTARWTR